MKDKKCRQTNNESIFIDSEDRVFENGKYVGQAIYYGGGDNTTINGERMFIGYMPITTKKATPKTQPVKTKKETG